MQRNDTGGSRPTRITEDDMQPIPRATLAPAPAVENIEEVFEHGVQTVAYAKEDHASNSAKCQIE